MRTKEVEKCFIGEILFHVAINNEVVKVKYCNNQTVSTMYVENDVLNVVTKDAQYLYSYFSTKNIES